MAELVVTGIPLVVKQQKTISQLLHEAARIIRELEHRVKELEKELGNA